MYTLRLIMYTVMVMHGSILIIVIVIGAVIIMVREILRVRFRK